MTKVSSGDPQHAARLAAVAGTMASIDRFRPAEVTPGFTLALVSAESSGRANHGCRPDGGHCGLAQISPSGFEHNVLRQAVHPDPRQRYPADCLAGTALYHELVSEIRKFRQRYGARAVAKALAQPRINLLTFYAEMRVVVHWAKTRGLWPQGDRKAQMALMALLHNKGIRAVWEAVQALRRDGGFGPISKGLTLKQVYRLAETVGARHEIREYCKERHCRPQDLSKEELQRLAARGARRQRAYLEKILTNATLLDTQVRRGASVHARP